MNNYNPNMFSPQPYDPQFYGTGQSGYNPSGGAFSQMDPNSPYGPLGYGGAMPTGNRVYTPAAAPGALGATGRTVGNYGTVAAGDMGATGSMDPNLSLPGTNFSNAPQLAYTPEYGDYEQLGSTAQMYGSAAGSALEDPRTQASLAILGQGAMGQMAGQQQQANATGLLGQAAAGRVPSAAEIQMQQGTQQALANAQSQAASTRGNAGLANAQANAMGVGAGLSQNAVTNAAALRANEMAAARSAYAQAGQAQAQTQLQGAGAYNAAAMGNQSADVNYGLAQQQAYQAQQAQALEAAQAQTNAYLGQGSQNLQNKSLDQQQNQYDMNLYMGLAKSGMSAMGGGLNASAL